MSRPGHTYRAARRNAAKRARLLWREGRMTSAGRGHFRYGWHASMPQSAPNGLPAPTERKAA